MGDGVEATKTKTRTDAGYIFVEFSITNNGLCLLQGVHWSGRSAHSTVNICCAEYTTCHKSVNTPNNLNNSATTLRFEVGTLLKSRLISKWLMSMRVFV